MSASVTSGTVYELRSIADTSICLGVASSSMADGASIIRWSSLGVNDQKWTATDTGSGWRLTNANSGKYMVVYNANIADGESVIQWGSGTKWNIVQLNGSDTVTIDGTECPKCVIYAGSGTSYALTYDPSGYAAIKSYDANDTLQQWALMPTFKVNSQIPAPYKLGYSENIGEAENGGNVRNVANDGTLVSSAKIYPRWDFPPVFSNSPTFLLRSRTRVMLSANSQWQAWSSWTDWGAVTYTQAKNTFWSNSQVSSNPNATRKLSQYQYEIKAQDSDGYVGASATLTVTFWQRPVLTWGNPTWTPEKLSFPCSSTYQKGVTYIYIDSIKEGTKELLAAPVSLSCQSGFASIDIPQADMVAIPTENASLTVTYRVGTDQRLAFDYVYTVSKTVSYDGGTTPPTVNIAENTGRTLKVTFSGSDKKLWMLVGDELHECPLDGSAFIVAYPFNKEYTLFATGTSGIDWFAWHSTRTESVSPIHAINWDGGYIFVEYDVDNPLTDEDSIEAVYDAYNFDSRAYQTVTFAPTRKQQKSIGGVLVDALSTSDRDAIGDAVGRHATYRSPTGDIYPCAVIGCSRKAYSYYTEVTVKIVREAE